MATTGKKRVPRSKRAASPAPKVRQRTTAQATPTGASRLGKGALQSLVVEHLHSNRGEDFTPTQIGNALGRSSGAVGNALHKFARDTESPVVQTSTKPRRYSVPKAGQRRTRTKR